MSDEEDTCGTGARLRAEYEIAVEELSYARDLWNCKRLQDKECLDNWLPLIEEVVGVIGYAYCSSFRLLESGNFKN
jgi:hypothetical protein